MPELESLLLVLALIYGTECLLWVRLGSVALVSFWGSRYRIFHPGLVANDRGGLVLAQPLPLFGFVFVSRQFPLSVSPVGIFSFVATSVQQSRRPAQPGVWIPFDNLRDLKADGKKLYANGQLLLKLASAIDSNRMVALLSQLRGMDQTQRATAIQQLWSNILNTGEIEHRLDLFHSKAILLRRLGNVFFFSLFILAPAVVWVFGFRASGWPVLAVLLAQSVTIAFLFRSAHKMLFPGGAEERFVPFMLMLLAPASAIRAHDFLARHLLEEFHPLAACKILCSQSEFKEFARQTLTDFHYPLYPISPTDEELASTAEQWFRNVGLQTIEGFLRKSGIEPNEFVAPPPADPESQAYCPRCHAQFVKMDGVCLECGGRPCIPFARRHLV